MCTCVPNFFFSKQCSSCSKLWMDRFFTCYHTSLGTLTVHTGQSSARYNDLDHDWDADIYTCIYIEAMIMIEVEDDDHYSLYYLCHHLCSERCVFISQPFNWGWTLTLTPRKKLIIRIYNSLDSFWCYNDWASLIRLLPPLLCKAYRPCWALKA